MLSNEFSNFLEKQCKLGNVRSIMLPIPCRTLSVAQSRGGRALRSKEQPRGTTDFHTESELLRIDVGNHILDKCIVLLSTLNQFRIPFIIENPQSSYIWHDSVFALQIQHGQDLVIHQCALGARHQTAKRLVFCNFG